MKTLNRITNLRNPLKPLLVLCGVIASMFDWTEHLFWEIGWMIIQFCKGNIEGAIEMTYWIRIHLAYSGKCVSKSKLSFKQHFQNKCVELVGIIASFGLLFIAGKFISYWL